MSAGDMDRRGFWRAALRGVVPKPERTQPDAPQPAPVIRPPGALPEAAFLSTCESGCRACVDACPSFVIIPSLEPHQPGGGDGRPYLLPERAACTLCGDCIPVCPTGALAATAAADVRIGIAVIDFGTCVRPTGESCTDCLDHCPLPGSAIREVDELPEIVEAACTGCGLCAVACPPHAIAVVAR